MADYQVEDCKALLSELKEEDSRLRLKRRWLMDLPMSERDHKRIKKLDPLSDKSIPESMLREDDLYYDNIKNFAESVSGTSTSGKEHALCPEKLFENGTLLKNLSSVLDGMTNKGLCSLSKLVTEGSVDFEKTKQKMRKIIKKHLPSYLDCKNSDLEKRRGQISSLLKNPLYFSGNHEDLCSLSDCFCGSAIRVLDMLEELPPQTLEAMHRRLKGKTGSSISKLSEHRKARKKRELVRAVRICCMKMLRELDEGKHPPKSLVEALSIAGVTLKLLLGHTHVTEFKRFSPEVEALQNSIAKAIHLINTEKKVNADLLEVIVKKLHLMSEHEVEVSKRSLRFAVRNRLIEYLVECSDMESIPKPLVEILNDINNTSCSSSSGSTLKNEVEEEVEFLLCFSALIKQIMWDLLPEDEDVDQDFATAYMEEPEDDDEEDYTNEFLASRDFEHFDSNECSNSVVSESIGETKPDQSPVSTPKPYDSPLVKQEPLDFDQESGSFRCNGFSSFSYRNQSFSRNRPLLATFEDFNNEAKPDDSELKTNRKDTLEEGHMQGQFGNLHQQPQCTRKNKYLSIQRACDETAIAMHRAIDGILNELAKS